MLRCILIDDERHCVKTLANMLESYFPEITVLATCLDSTKAFDLIREHKPDFIFLD
jgi:two-component system LytT family response regulator